MKSTGNHLSNRLEAILSILPECGCFADIGTDHGFIPIEAIRRGKAVRALAMDIGTGPLERAEEHIRKAFLSDRVECRRSDGMKLLKTGEADGAVITGMGGELILRILQESDETAKTLSFLVISPQSELRKVRAWLEENGYLIRKELLIEEDGKYYPILLVVPERMDMDQEEPKHQLVPDELRYRFGAHLLLKKDPVLKEFLSREKRILKEISERLASASEQNSENAGKRLEEVKTELSIIQEALSYYEDETIMGFENAVLKGTGTIQVDGRTVEFEKGISYEQLLRRSFPDLVDKVLLVKANNRLRELHRTVKDGAKVTWITLNDPNGTRALQRSVCMLMNCALRKITDNQELQIHVQFAISDALYCTLGPGRKVTQEFLDQLRDQMKQLVERDLHFTKKTVSTQSAIRFFRDQKMEDKERLFHYRLNSHTNVYELDGFTDYNYGYMVSRTGLLKNWEIELYDEGFVLRLPEKPGQPFAPGRKLFQTQKKSEEWAQTICINNVAQLNDLIVRGGMRDLILTQEAYHDMQIAAIASQIAADRNRKIILIAGPSSSGKTTFSHRLSAQLSIYGFRPRPIEMDNYFVDRENTPRDENGDYNFECLEAIDVSQFNHDMLALLAGETVQMPTFNFKTGKREYKGNTLKMTDRDILVIEGIHGLNEQLAGALPSKSKFRIYISALTQLNIDNHNRIPTTDGRLIRRIVRDARTRGTKAEDTIAMWPSVRRGEQENIFPFQESADVMFNSALLYELAVLKIYAQPLLYGIESSSPQYAEAQRLLKFLAYFVPAAPEGIPIDSLIREFIGGSCFGV